MLFGCADNGLIVAQNECAAWCRIQVTDTNLNDVWSDGKRFWIIGDDGVVVHYDGDKWNANRASSHNLIAITGDSKGQIFAVGEEGTVLKWDNGQFNILPTSQYSGYRFSDVSANSNGTWIIGHSSDNSQPEAVVVHLKDAQFQTVWPPKEQDFAFFFTGLCVTDNGSAFVMGGRGEEPEPLLLSGMLKMEIITDGLTELPSGCASNRATVAVIDREGTEVTLIMENETRNISANVSQSQGQSNFQAGARAAMWLSSERSGIAVADAIVMFDDNGFESFASPRLLNDIHGDAPKNVYAVGESGLIMHYNGIHWDTIRDTGSTLKAIWVSAQHIVAVGDKGTVLINSKSQK